jgi:hypothetical protein
MASWLQKESLSRKRPKRSNRSRVSNVRVHRVGYQFIVSVMVVVLVIWPVAWSEPEIVY